MLQKWTSQQTTAAPNPVSALGMFRSTGFFMKWCPRIHGQADRNVLFPTRKAAPSCRFSGGATFFCSLAITAIAKQLAIVLERDAIAFWARCRGSWVGSGHR